MKTDDPLLAAWDETLARRRDEPALFDPQRGVLARFGEIEEWSRRYGSDDGGLKDFRAGEIVAIQIGNHAHWPALFLACLRRGVVVLPLVRTMSEQERAAALHTCRATGLIAAPEEPIARLDPGGAIDWAGRVPTLLKLTSGTTAAPRAIRFRSAQLLADAVQICDTMGITDADLNFAVIPLSHSYGFSNLITPLLVRGVPMALSSDRIPRAVLDDLARTESTVFPGMPLFFQAFGEMNEVPPLPKLRLCISAGAPLSRAVARNFRKKFGRPIHSFYGASECGGICYDRDPTDAIEGLVGPTLQGVELEPLEPGAGAAQVRVRSSAVGDGYFPQPEPDKLGDGVFLPDDLVTPSAAGVRIVGRLSDVINVAGKKVNPAEVETVLRGSGEFPDVVVVGLPDAEWGQLLVAVYPEAAQPNLAKVSEAMARLLSPAKRPKRFIPLSPWPANPQGKVNRAEVARLAEQMIRS